MYKSHRLNPYTEDFAKGKNDRPVEDVIIVDCGEVNKSLL